MQVVHFVTTRFLRFASRSFSQTRGTKGSALKGGPQTAPTTVQRQFGSEFSPSQIDLSEVLELAHQLGDDWREFEKAVRERYFDHHNTSDNNRRKLANNTKLAMRAYGVIEVDSARLTPFGEQLYAIRNQKNHLYATFARHILLNLHGHTLLECIRDMQAAGEQVTLIKLRQWLGDRGVTFPRGGKHPSIMRLWLEKAGVFRTGWQIDEARLEAILGHSHEELEALSVLTPEQRTYLMTLVNLDADGPFGSSDVERMATSLYGTRFDEKNLPKSVLYPLSERGYIKLERGTRKAGRGAKPFTVTRTDKLRGDIVGPLLEQFAKQVGADLRPFLRKPFAEVRSEVHSQDRHVKGLALEALGVKLMRLLDLTYVTTRLRGDATGGAEVDIIFESSRLVFSRWQVQCKNTARVSLDDVAKEVGLTHFLKCNVVVIVTTGEIGPEARRYASKIMQDSNLCVVMVDGSDIDAIENNPVPLWTFSIEKQSLPCV